MSRALKFFASVLFASFFLFELPAFGEGSPATAALSQMGQGSATPSTPVASATPAPVAAVIPVPAGTPAGPAVAVALPAAPPTWAQDLVMTAQGLPVVGPIVAKVLVYVGILSSILTTLVGTVLAILSALMGVFNLAGLVNAANAVAAFRDGKIMYWLRFFSLFNAKKDDSQPK